MKRKIIIATLYSLFIFFGLALSANAQTSPFDYNPDPSIYIYDYAGYQRDAAYLNNSRPYYTDCGTGYSSCTNHTYDYTPSYSYPSTTYGYGQAPLYNNQTYTQAMTNPYVAAHYRDRAQDSGWSFDMSGNNVSGRTGGSYSAPVVKPYVHVDLYSGRNDAYGFFGVQQL